MNYTDITATEGDTNVSFAFDIYIEKEKLAEPTVQESLYHVINDMKTPINVMTDIRPPKFPSCDQPDSTSCQCTMDREFAHVYSVMLTNLTTADDGVYLLEVTTGSRNFSASITLSGKIFSITLTIIIINFIYFLVIPSTTTSTSTTIISIPSIITSQTISTSPSLSPSPSSSSIPIGNTPIYTHIILVHNNNIHVLCIDHLPHTFLKCRWLLRS